ncbi:haloacid dehalogenase-like hydrolase [Modestobacter lacusdianchii]
MRHRPLEEPVLAVDLDGTLLRGNTFPGFVRLTYRRLVADRRVVPLARLGGAVVRRKLFRGPHVDFKAAVHRAGRLVDVADVEAWIDDLLAHRVHEEVADLVATWPGNTILVTAAPSVYADRIADRFGFTCVQASDYVGDTYVENVHENKAVRLQAVLSGDLDCAVTDDVVIDGPLLRMAARPLVVDPLGSLHPLAN